MRIGLVQMLVEGGRPQENLDRAVSRIEEATKRGAQFVVLPEALNLGWTHPSARQLAENIPDGRTCAALRAAARRCGILICAGVVELDGGRIFNSAVLFNADGTMLLRHRKIHELEIAHHLYDRGTELGVVPTSHGKIGVMICADAFAPGEVISRTLGLMGARLIVSPCAWATPADYDHIALPYGDLWRRVYGAVAKDFGLWIAGVSNVGPIAAGPWAGRACIGCSMVVGPSGAAELTGPYGEGAEAILIYDISLNSKFRGALGP